MRTSTCSAKHFPCAVTNSSNVAIFARARTNCSSSSRTRTLATSLPAGAGPRRKVSKVPASIKRAHFHTCDWKIPSRRNTSPFSFAGAALEFTPVDYANVDKPWRSEMTFVAELDRVTRGKTFRIQGTIGHPRCVLLVLGIYLR